MKEASTAEGDWSKAVPSCGRCYYKMQLGDLVQVISLWISDLSKHGEGRSIYEQWSVMHSGTSQGCPDLLDRGFPSELAARW